MISHFIFGQRKDTYFWVKRKVILSRISSNISHSVPFAKLKFSLFIKKSNIASVEQTAYPRLTNEVLDKADLQKQQGNRIGTSKPIVYGLAQQFATTANTYFPCQYVLDILPSMNSLGERSWL